MSIRIRFLGHATFEIVLPSGKVLVIDPSIEFSSYSPIRLEEITGADYIAVTEDAAVSVVDVVPLVQKFNSKVICSPHVGECLHGKLYGGVYFNLDYANVVEVGPGETIEFDDLIVEVKKAEHISLLESSRSQYRLAHGKEPDPRMTSAELYKLVPPFVSGSRTFSEEEERRHKERILQIEAAGMIHQGAQLNFLFHTRDNLRTYLYRSGTYEYLRRELERAHPNILLCQLLGNDPVKLAEFAALSGAEVIIPSHHDVRGRKVEQGLLETMSKRLAELAPRARLENLARGEWYEIGVGIKKLC